MPKLRKAVIDRVLSSLDDTRFGLSSYKVVFPESGSSVIDVVFLPDDSYGFYVQEVEEGSGYLVSITPGEVNVTDVIALEGFSHMYVWLDIWGRRINEEIRAKGSASKSIEEVQQFLEGYVTENVANPSESFSKDELADIQQRLSSLEERFKELHEAATIDEAQLKKLSKEVSRASADAGHFPKGVWYRASLGKVLTVMKGIAQSQESRKILVDMVRKQLGLDP